MPRFKYALGAALGLLLLVGVLTLIGPKRALAALGYTPVRDADNPARQPFQQQCQNGIGCFTVPADKRLVIEYVSATFGARENGELTVYAYRGSTPRPQLSVPVRDGFANQQMRYYIEPGDTFYMASSLDAQVGATSTNSAVGYLVNLP